MEKKTIKVEKPTTPTIDESLKYVNLLQEHSKAFLSGTFFSGAIPFSDKILFLKELARAKAQLWANVRATYPETEMVTSAIVNNLSVSWEKEEYAEEAPPTKGK